MTTTDWHLAEAFAHRYPNTFASMQRLVMAMAELSAAAGKRSLLGRPKDLAANQKFHDQLYATLCAMAGDGLLQAQTSPSECRKTMVSLVQAFASAFPNWPDAYAFADQYFVQQAALAEDVLGELMSSGSP